MKSTRILLIPGIALSLLLIPLIGMQVSDDVDWSTFDFIIMGILLLGTGLIIEFALRKFKTFKSRVIACGIILGIFFLIWAELAVGIFGTPFAGS